MLLLFKKHTLTQIHTYVYLGMPIHVYKFYAQNV